MNKHNVGTALRKQAGLAAVEFAILATAFMIIVFGAIEVSRLLFTWNTLDAVTQRAARVAAVCPIDPSYQNQIKQVAMFGSAAGTTTLLPGFTAANIDIAYLNSDFTQPVPATVRAAYVRARITGYTHSMAIPLIGGISIASPQFSITLPSESLGFVPSTGTNVCYT